MLGMQLARCCLLRKCCARGRHRDWDVLLRAQHASVPSFFLAQPAAGVRAEPAWRIAVEPDHALPRHLLRCALRPRGRRVLLPAAPVAQLAALREARQAARVLGSDGGPHARRGAPRALARPAAQPVGAVPARPRRNSRAVASVCAAQHAHGRGVAALAHEPCALRCLGPRRPRVAPARARLVPAQITCAPGPWNDTCSPYAPRHRPPRTGCCNFVTPSLLVAPLFTLFVSVNLSRSNMYGEVSCPCHRGSCCQLVTARDSMNSALALPSEG